MNKVFQNVGGVNAPRSVFNLTHEKKFTADMGLLIPTLCEPVVPGDVFDIGNEVVIRFQPLVAPILHEINCYIHTFFVPYRILWDEWEDFITGGSDGQYEATIPTWNPATGETDLGTLWDYLGFPTSLTPTGKLPIDFPRNAYNQIYNDYYRDENLIDEYDLDDSTLKRRAWEKDYFTSSLPWQQRGTAPALPITGTTSAVWSQSTGGTQFDMLGDNVGGTTFNPRNTATEGLLNNNTIDLSAASTFDIADLRLAFQIQRWLERNARAGSRYTEFLRSHFGVAPRDERLNRPEYIGGSKTPVIVSEVLQTSSTDATTPQGNLAGHGLSVDSKYIGKYRVKEYGIIMSIMSVMPRSAYSQGIERFWTRETKYDFFFPEFANLSEQAITQSEIFATESESANNTLFGYQGRYDELRQRRSQVCGELRAEGNLNYWTLGREFGSAPLLNQSFIECNPSKRIFAVQDEPGLIVNIGNIIKAVRPLPFIGEPGLIDHH